ncbi:uncharacterized RING finger protein C2A9.04c-like [Phasianus colchicus]|uniref:uncharacterized RING finger protein C2A9.04c-like n=1 Tax=Phasianus colchicus TaxID=9054 RepID=UPI00129EFA9A|nr:uncharacterized RING finger protein C2A9.04c-like [Phasianus colchicus]
MATELDRRCPICLDTMDDASYVMPCLHQFCFGCIQRWAESRPTCPLCKRRVESILHSVRADDSFQEVVVGQQVRARTAPHHTTTAEEQPAAVPAWASISRQPPAVLQPLLPWLHQELGQLFGADHRAAAAAQRRVISGLCFLGLDEGALTLWLLCSLRSQTTSFVQRLVVQAAYVCNGLVPPTGPEASHAATGQEGSPAAARGAAASQAQTPVSGPRPSSSTGEDNVPVPSAAALSEGPSQPPSLPAPLRTSQQAAQEEPGEAVPGPSSTNRARERSRRAPRRAPKRRAHDSEASAPPAKRPPRRQR